MQKFTCAWSKSCEQLLETNFILQIFNADGRTLATKKEKNPKNRNSNRKYKRSANH
jgi:hypothetical protein